jgi:nitrate reductase NapE component
MWTALGFRSIKDARRGRGRKFRWKFNQIFSKLKNESLCENQRRRARFQNSKFCRNSKSYRFRMNLNVSQISFTDLQFLKLRSRTFLQKRKSERATGREKKNRKIGGSEVLLGKLRCLAFFYFFSLFLWPFLTFAFVGKFYFEVLKTANQ